MSDMLIFKDLLLLYVQQLKWKKIKAMMKEILLHSHTYFIEIRLDILYVVLFN